jgi:predicted RNA-binding protein with PIN domain
MPLLIDGYNLLRAVQKMDSEAQVVSEAGLCRVLSDYLRYGGEMGEIIFDGTGPREKAIFSALANLDVTFSGAGIEADDVIENRIAANTAPKRLIVVSTDNRVRIAAERRRATAVKSEEFWPAVLAMIAERKKRRKNAEPREKYQGISAAETEYWLRVFGFIKNGES